MCNNFLWDFIVATDEQTQHRNAFVILNPLLRSSQLAVVTKNRFSFIGSVNWVSKQCPSWENVTNLLLLRRLCFVDVSERPGLNEWNEISWRSIITGRRFVFVSLSNPNKFLIIRSGLKAFVNYVECFCVFPHHDLRTPPIHKDRSRKREITRIQDL